MVLMDLQNGMIASMEWHDWVIGMVCVDLGIDANGSIEWIYGML